MAFPPPCVLLMLDAAAGRGLCLCVGPVQPLNGKGCWSVIVTNTNTFTSAVIQLGPGVRGSGLLVVGRLNLPASRRAAQGLSGTRCDLLLCFGLQMLLFLLPLYPSQTEFHKLNGIKHRLRMITDC